MSQNSLIFSELVKALPQDENPSSYAVHKSYLNKLSVLGYCEDLLPYLVNPIATCKSLKDSGFTAKDVTNIFKAFRFVVTKAQKHVNAFENMIDKSALDAILSYKTSIIDEVYSKKITIIKSGGGDGYNKRTVSNNELFSDGDAEVTDGDEDEVDDFNIINRMRNAASNADALKKLQKQYEDLEHKFARLQEKQEFFERLMLEVLKVTHSDGITKLLFEMSMQSFT